MFCYVGWCVDACQVAFASKVMLIESLNEDVPTALYPA